MAIKVGGTNVFQPVVNAGSGVMMANITDHGTTISKYYITSASNDNKFNRGDLGNIVYDRTNLSNKTGEAFYLAFATGGELRVQFNSSASTNMTLRRNRAATWTTLATFTGTGVKTHDFTIRGGDHVELYRTGGSNMTFTYCRVIVDSDCLPMFTDWTDT